MGIKLGRQSLLRLNAIDSLIIDRGRLDVALALDDVILVDYLRRDMIKTIRESYGIDSIDEALARFNNLVKGIDHVEDAAEIVS